MRSLALLLLLAAAARAAEPTLSFRSGDLEVLHAAAADLRALKGARVIEVADPVYGRTKRYRAVPLRDLMTKAFGAAWVEDGVGEIFFESSDGYRAHARAPLLTEEGAMIAFEDADVPGWEPIPGRGGRRPGPFYLVWTGAGQTPANGYPWPYQLVSVRPALVEEVFPKAVPRGAAPDSPAARGWSTFRARCLACHAMSGDGGTVGPDLNEPRGITSYRDKKQLKAYILRPSSFRHTRMPDFPDLTPRDLDDLTSYFDLLSRRAGTR